MAAPAPSGFSLTAFEAGIRTAMQLGLSPIAEERPVFILPVSTAPAVPSDARRIPWDVDDAMTAATTELADVLCAYELGATGATDDRNGGTFAAQSRALTVTLLPAEYDQVKDCIAVRIAGTTYSRWFDAPPYGMATSGVYQLMFKAGDMA